MILEDEKVVFLVSKYGYPPFGGGEHFLIDIGKCYKQEGYTPYLVGYNKKSNTQVNEAGHLKYFNIKLDKRNIIRIFQRFRPKVVHILAGNWNIISRVSIRMGIPVVYGLHFWRDIFDVDRDGYQNIEMRTSFYDSFYTILNHCDFVYANSKFSQDICNKGYKVKLPVIYSLPDEKNIEITSIKNRNRVLLINAHPWKGFNIFLETASMLPELKFVAIANQTSRSEALCKAKGFNKHCNIEILGHQTNLNVVYNKAKVVLVQSIESFGRVVIEAHSRGIPCIGINKGNVKYLLKNSGIIVDKNSKAVYQVIKKLHNDSKYYHELSQKAFQNASKYSFSQQYIKVKDLINYIQNKILVCVGAGIGNIIRTTPIIKRIAKRYETKVDVFLREDCAEFGAVIENEKYVNAIITNKRVALERKYHIVFITGCYGWESYDFRAYKIIHPQKEGFLFSQECKNMHEAEYGTRSLKFLDDEIPLKKPDWGEFFVGNFKYVSLKNEKPIIGIHSGIAKTSLWINKQYPYFNELVSLILNDYEVWSFGRSHEFLQEAINKTGTDLKQTIKNMLKCDLFIANDTGLLQIADILGIPSIAIFGPTSLIKNSPIAKTTKVLKADLPCSPCQYTPKQTQCKNNICMPKSNA